MNLNGRLTIHRLNLAVASRIYLLEPQWNPSIESQAIGRALRLGQTAQVVIIRYIMMHTVEEVCNSPLLHVSWVHTLTDSCRAMFYLAKERNSSLLEVDLAKEKMLHLKDSNRS